LQPFDLSRCELSGVNLIEASAGTGKTHALTGLFLRLIIENNLTPPQILVITFTNAATAELKSRIREKLISAQKAFQGKDKGDDELIRFLLERYASESQKKTILKQISLALADYDETAICTIHGFCDRVLRENAFESGTIFDAEIVANQQGIVGEFVSDFWRKHIYENHPLIVKYALARKFSRDTLMNLLNSVSSKPDMRVLPDLCDLNRESLEKEYALLRRTFEEFRKIWSGKKEEILALLKSEALRKNVYGNQVEKIAAQTDALARLSEPVIPLPERFVKLTPASIQKATKARCALPRHRLFDVAEELSNQCRDLEEKLNGQLLFLQKKFIDAVLNEFPSMKRRKNVLYFNDLLFGARKALDAHRGKRLREALRERYRAVLVDEFQDTDPIQYAIVDTIFVSSQDEKASAVFYVGDPKQAIYGFRGADVFAYLRAARAATRRYTMMKNWRSEEGLINAINAIFSLSGNPFIYREIQYIRVSGAERTKTRKLLEDGRATPAMRILFLASENKGGDKSSWNKTDAAEIIMASVVNEIVRLLKSGRENRLLIGDHPVRESDIAVLVRTNRQTADFQKALNRAGVATTLQSSQSVFQTDEAREMKRFLLGVAHPDDDGILLAALATPLIGLGAEALGRCLDEDLMMEQWREIFRQCHDGFVRNGFLTMFYDFLEKQHIRPRILTYPDGLRKITNYLHLAEEIHLAQREENLNIGAVLRWFDLMLERDSELAGEREQLRLEDDKNAVHLVTIHKSKGLEYGIVFCPFVWEGAKDKAQNGLFCFHDEENDHAMTCDLNPAPSENFMAQWRKENLAEEVRLLYVALTRAKNRCVFVWGNIKNIRHSALWHVLFGPSDELEQEELNDQLLLNRLRELAALAPEDIDVSVLGQSALDYLSPTRADKEEARPRTFGGFIDESWKIASYSYLTGMKKQVVEEMPLIEEENVFLPEIPVPEEKGSENMFSFPRGTIAGSLLHEVLESVDFSSLPHPDTTAVILEKLRKYNFDEKWAPVVFKMIADVAGAKLKNPFSGSGRDFRLAFIGPHQCLKELAFTFPVAEMSLRKIIDVLQSHRIIDVEKRDSELYHLSIKELRGYFKGFIDLVFEYENRFYLLDWKSNYLGGQYEDYSPKIIRDYMRRSSYVLQYLIYTVALDQYLRTRVRHYDYERHFGGVYYIFLRGIGTDAPEENGIYFERISPDLLTELHAIFRP